MPFDVAPAALGVPVLLATGRGFCGVLGADGGSGLFAASPMSSNALPMSSENDVLGSSTLVSNQRNLRVSQHTRSAGG